ncbi:MAG: diaminopimelate epimerase, partial [Bacteroidota bacterium]|nr:diaminopimelate epimerase [Bacteroidota bacterium]
NKEGYDFEMKYFNADGKESSMCGNGARCMVKFARQLGIHKNLYRFIAVNEEYEAEIDDDDTVAIKMQDVPYIKERHGDFIVNTGSPHYVKMVSDVMTLDVFRKGKDIRYSKDFEEEGINVNFVEQLDDVDRIIVRTYERGVEDETLSCGTGVTAAALVCFHNDNGFNRVEVKTLGGDLSVEFDRIDESGFQNIWLCGPAEKVFEGDVQV